MRRKRISNASANHANENDENDDNDDVGSIGIRRRIIYDAASPIAPSGFLRRDSRSSSSFSQPNAPILNRYDPSNVESSHDPQVTNDAAAALLQNPINTPGDAFQLLLEASGHSEGLDLQDRNIHRYQNDPCLNGRAITSGHRSARSNRVESLVNQRCNTNIDPALIKYGLSNVTKAEGSQDAAEVWSRLRFVRAGWFTAREAVSYVD